MPATIDLAICLRQQDWSETSQTAVFFTRDHGLVRGLAKGARRPRSSFDGGIESLAVGQLGAIYTPHKDLLTITSWSATRHHAALRRSLPAYAAAMFMADLTLRLFAPMDPHPEVADALIEGLDAATPPSGAATYAAVRFAMRALTVAGLTPSLPPENGIGAGDVMTFLPAEARFTSGRSSTQGGEDGWLVRVATVRLLARALREPAALPDAEDSARALRFLSTWTEWRTGTRPRAADFLSRVIGP